MQGSAGGSGIPIRHCITLYLRAAHCDSECLLLINDTAGRSGVPTGIPGSVASRSPLWCHFRQQGLKDNRPETLRGRSQEADPHADTIDHEDSRKVVKRWGVMRMNST